MHTILEDSNWEEEVETFLRKAYFSGERMILRGKEGVSAALVPLEDLEILEEIDP
ncbi:MAG: hypothetical protein KDK59_07620 [Simkania sp.]|nr:hypothetical protein [Simkania sp.]MCP5491279.1 hypothetical protein [Chlamydiales bacterium]